MKRIINKKIIKIILYLMLVFILIFLIIVYIKFYNNIIIKTYDYAHFTIIEKTISDYEALELLDKIEEDGYSLGTEEYEDEYIKRMKKHIKIRDYSRKGIVCENVWIIGSSGKLSKYAVVYNDRTVKYIVGRFTTDPNFVTPGDSIIDLTGYTNYAVDVTNMIFVKDIQAEKEIKLSRLEYFILINKLKLINLFKLSTGENDFFPNHMADYATGFHMNGKAYCYEEKNMSDFSYKFKMYLRMNCDNYINKCLGYKSKKMAGKE